MIPVPKNEETNLTRGCPVYLLPHGDAATGVPSV